MCNLKTSANAYDESVMEKKKISVNYWSVQ